MRLASALCCNHLILAASDFFDVHVHMIRDHDPTTFVCQLWASGDDQAAHPILALQWFDFIDPCPVVRLNSRREAEARALEPRLLRQGYFFQLNVFVDVVWTVFGSDDGFNENHRPRPSC